MKRQETIQRELTEEEEQACLVCDSELDLNISEALLSRVSEEE